MILVCLVYLARRAALVELLQLDQRARLEILGDLDVLATKDEMVYSIHVTDC